MTRGQSSRVSTDSEGSELREHVDAMDRQGHVNGYPFSDPESPPIPGISVGPPVPPNGMAVEKMSPRDPSRSTTRRHRDHNNSGATRELVRFLAAEGLNSKEALRVLGRTSDRLDYETRRANETEQRLRETQERWRAVNQARIAAQQEAGRLNEELRLHKTQLETAQAQIARANDMIAVSDREKLRAEEAAEKAKEQARRLQEERVAHRARGEGRKIGRDEGWMQGREAGYNEAVEDAYQQAREYALQQLDDYLERRGLPPRDYDDEGVAEDEVQREEDLVSPDSYDQPPTSAVVDRDRSRQRAERAAIQQQQQQQAPRPREVLIPQPITIVAKPNTPRRSNTFTRAFSRLRRNKRPNGSVSGDVEVNVNAPDVAPIMHSAPLQTVATPLPQSEISQAMYQPRAPSRSSRAGSILQQQQLQQQLQQNGNGGGEGMPEPNFNPDPRTVRPISVRNSSPTLTHPHVEVPPDGWIPSADADGTIGLPPPHELSQAIPSPRGSPASSHRRLGDSDLAGGAIPPPPPPPPPKEPISRDYGYHREREREPVKYDYLERPQRAGGGGHGHGHGRAPSLPESTTSTATNQFDLLSNAPLSASHRGDRGDRGLDRGERGERGLSAIPEQRESRHGTPKSSGTGRRMSAASGHNHEFASNAAYEYGDGGEQGRGQRPRDRSQRIADELRYSNPDGGPSVHEPVIPIPRSPLSPSSSGPPRPTQLTMPPPLASHGPTHGPHHAPAVSVSVSVPGLGMGMEQQVYTRPRVNSTGSDNTERGGGVRRGGPGAGSGYGSGAGSGAGYGYGSGSGPGPGPGYGPGPGMDGGGGMMERTHGRTHAHAHTSSVDSVPEINILPPSRSGSNASKKTRGSQGHGHNNSALSPDGLRNVPPLPQSQPHSSMEQQQHWAHQKTTDWTKPPAGGSTVVFPVAGGGGGGGGGNGNDIPFVHELPPWFTPMTTMQSLPTPGGSAPPKSLRSTIAGSGSSTLSPADKTGDWVRSQENTPKHTHRNGAADDGWGHGTSERNGSLLNQYGRPGAQAAPFGGAGPSSLSSSSTTLHQPPSGTGAHTRSASYGGAADGRNYSLSSVGSVSGSGSGAGLRRPSSPMPHAGGSHSRSNSSAHALSPKSSQKYGTVAGLSNVVGSITLRGDPSLSRAADPSHTPGQNGFHPTSDALARSNTSILGPSLSSRRSAGHVGPGAPITVQTSSAGSNGRRTPHIDGLPGGAERGDAFGFSGYGNPRPESRNALPIPNPSIDPRRGASNAADPGGPVIPRSHRTSELSYVDPDPSVFPISAPSMSRRRSRRDSGASRHSTSSATSTVRRSRGVPLPSSTYRDTSNYDSHAYPIPPPQSRSRSPASSVASTAARGRRVALPASTAGDSTRERRAYPGTPFQRPSPTLEDDEDEDNGFPGGFREDVADHDHALKRSTSRISVSSNKSHKHYDRNEFLDPAFLAIDTNMFLSNGGSGGPSRFSGAYN